MKKKRVGDNGKRKPIIDELGNKWCNCTRPNLVSNHGIGCGSVYCIKCHNVMRLTEVGDFETITLNIKRMLNRSRNVDITTEPPILVRCCYVPFFLHKS